MELRLLLESLIYCYIASKFPAKYPLDKIFEQTSTSRIIKEFGEMIGLKEEPIKLWSKISNNWTHALHITGKEIEGIIGRIIRHMDKHVIPPFLTIPLPYDSFKEESLPILQEARKRISQFKKILQTTLNQPNSLEHISF